MILMTLVALARDLEPEHITIESILSFGFAITPILNPNDYWCVLEERAIQGEEVAVRG
jgi:hypothetical protein